MSTTSPAVHLLSEGGIVAEHFPLPASEALVAPSADHKLHNTIKSSLVPFACWRASDLRFEFESSFVLPEIAKEIGSLKKLLDQHTLPDAEGKPNRRPALSVFGHADLTGNDDFNKLLSGRRAQAIYGMLVRKVEFWEDLFSHPLGNDQWDPKAILAMQTTLGKPLKERISSAERKALYKEYMDFVCTVRADDGNVLLGTDGQPVRLEVKSTDFLAGGQDTKGKGDFQGCGEFNPVLLVSEAEFNQFSDPSNKTERDERNRPNRRVLVLLFRPGVRIRPDVWPCPRAHEGVGGCRKRFWSDGEQRRTMRLPDKARRFDEMADTFACRFYQRLVTASPCERELKTFRVRLYDALGRTLPGAVFSVSVGGRPFSKEANADVEGNLTLQDIQVPETCVVKWGFKPRKDEKPALLFERTLFLVGDNEPGATASRKKLSNLGYSLDDDEANVTGFQLDFGHLATPPLPITGELDTRTTALLDRVYRQSLGDLRDTIITQTVDT